MSDDYVSGDRRRSKKDLKRKRLFGVYKKGGKYRSTDLKGTK